MLLVLLTRYQFGSSSILGYSVRRDHRTIEWLRFEKTFGGHLVQHPCSSRDTDSPLPKNISRQLWYTSRNGDSTTSLDNLCQYLVTLTIKSVSWCSQGNSCVSVCAHWLWSCPLPLLKRAWLFLLYSFPSGIHTHWENPYEFSLLQPEWFVVSQPFLIWEMLQFESINLPSGDALDSLPCVQVSLYWGAQHWAQNSKCSFPSAD